MVSPAKVRGMPATLVTLCRSATATYSGQGSLCSCRSAIATTSPSWIASRQGPRWKSVCACSRSIAAGFTALAKFSRPSRIRVTPLPTRPRTAVVFSVSPCSTASTSYGATRVRANPDRASRKREWSYTARSAPQGAGSQSGDATTWTSAPTVHAARRPHASDGPSDWSASIRSASLMPLRPLAASPLQPLGGASRVWRVVRRGWMAREPVGASPNELVRPVGSPTDRTADGRSGSRDAPVTPGAAQGASGLGAGCGATDESPDARIGEGGSRASHGTVSVSVALEPDPRNVSRARHVLRDALRRSGAEGLIDSAALLLSEIVTNAFVHAGTRVTVGVQS